MEESKLNKNVNQNVLENISNVSEVADATDTTETISTPSISNKTYIAQPLTKQVFESKERKAIRENFEFFGLITIIYAMFYTFCLYKNDSGITVPFLEVGTIYYYILMIKKLGKTITKDSAFYIISIILLGISICITDDIKLIMMSKLGILVLYMSFMLHLFYDDSNWNFGKYVESLGALAIITIASVCYPFSDAMKAIKMRQKKENGKIKYVLIGLVITAPITLIIMVLLLSADRIFEGIFASMIESLFVLKNLFSVILMIIISYILFYSFINAVAKKEIKEAVIDRRTQEPIIAITFSVIISMIYILFCGIQIVGLFCGKMKLPIGYTYAQYAREGFFQLLFVCGINLVIVLCCMAFFRVNKVLKIMMTIISVCTYIMIASSAYRMIIYISVYQLTFLRIFVLWSLFVIAILMIGILISIYKEKFPLYRYSMIVVTVFYIGLAFSHPDYFIASYNMNAIVSEVQKESYDAEYTNYGDIYYITSLSADAAPALVKYKSKEEFVTEYFININIEAEKIGIRNFNFSRYIAGKVAKNYLNY